MELAKGIEPSEYILAVLPQQERLEIAFTIAREAFEKTNLQSEDIESAIKIIRKRLYKGGKKTKSHN